MPVLNYLLSLVGQIDSQQAHISQTILDADCNLCTCVYSLLGHQPAVRTLRVFATLVGDRASCCNSLVLEQAPTQLLFLQHISQPCRASYGLVRSSSFVQWHVGKIIPLLGSHMGKIMESSLVGWGVGEVIQPRVLCEQAQALL